MNALASRTYAGWPALAVTVRPAAVIPASDSDIVPDVSDELVNVVLLLSVAVTVSEVPESEPVPVQPLTVKLCPDPRSLRLAFVNPLKLKVGAPATTNDPLLKIALAETLSFKVSDSPSERCRHPSSP